MDESLLVSNADRERVVARLSDAHVGGRLTVDELEQLTDAARTARTTIFVPAGRLIGLVVALSLMRDERLPERRRLLRAWALASGAVLLFEIVAVLLFVVHL